MGFAAEAAQQLRLALPATVTYLFGRSFVSICLIFIGRMGDLELAAAALANTTMNVSGLSVLVGMGTAVSTICGQAYGAKNYRKVGETLQLGLLVFCAPRCPLPPTPPPLTACFCDAAGAACVPISLLWWNIEGVLLLCGQDPAVSAYAARYLRWLIPFLWFVSAQMALNAFLNAQRAMKPGAVSSVLACPLHVGVCWVLFEALRADYAGGAAAMTISGVLQTLLMLGIVKAMGIMKRTWVPWSAGCLDGWRHFCKLALAGVISLSEWWASEIGILLAGELSTHSPAELSSSCRPSLLHLCAG